MDHSIAHPMVKGRLPRGWRVVTVDDIKGLDKSSCVAGPFGSNISSKYFIESGVPVIRGNNLRDDRSARFVATGFAFVSSEQAKKYKAQHVQSDDLVFTCWGTIGQIGLIPKGGPYNKYIISNKQLKLSINRDLSDPLYIFYHFSAPEMVQYIRNKAVGAAVPGINLGILKRLPVLLPPVGEQRRIASILGAYDDLIEVNRRRIALLEWMARRLFEEWFGHALLPQAKDELSAVDCPVKLPADWHNSALGEVAAINADTISPRTAPPRIGYIDIASVSVGEVGNVEWMSFASAPGRARRRVKDGSIIWSMVRPNRKSFALLLDPEPDTVASTGFAVMDALTLPASYLFHAVTTDAFVAYLTANATGSAYPAVTGAVFERARIMVPPRDLLTRFDGVAEPMLRQASTLRHMNNSLAAARDLLLPRLISGELTVAAAERALEDAA